MVKNGNQTTNQIGKIKNGNQTTNQILSPAYLHPGPVPTAAPNSIEGAVVARPARSARLESWRACNMKDRRAPQLSENLDSMCSYLWLYGGFLKYGYPQLSSILVGIPMEYPL